MRLRYGRHKGRTTESLLLRAPDYALWMLSVNPASRVSRAFRSLIAVLDAKPFVGSCQRCGRPATRAAAFAQSSRLLLFCDGCTLYPHDPPVGLSSHIRTVDEAVAHVERHCRRRLRRETRAIVRNLARAKGLPPRVTEEVAEAFFDGPPSTAAETNRPSR